MDKKEQFCFYYKSKILLDNGVLGKDSAIKKYLIAQKEGTCEVPRNVDYQNL